MNDWEFMTFLSSIYIVSEGNLTITGRRLDQSSFVMVGCAGVVSPASLPANTYAVYL